MDIIDVNKATVLDGELLKESKEANPWRLVREFMCSHVCFWVFDILCLNNRSTMQLSLLNRLHLIRTWVVTALHDCSAIPFEMRLKPMYNIEQTVFVWNEVVKELHHDCDGLVFTPIRDPYTSGTCLKLLKWKPLEFNSADFKIELLMTSGYYSLP